MNILRNTVPDALFYIVKNDEKAKASVLAFYSQEEEVECKNAHKIS